MLTPALQVVLQYTMEVLLGFIIPYPLIVGSYVCILRRIRQTKFQRRVRSEKLILAIVVTFCVFWLPYHVVNMMQVMLSWTAGHGCLGAVPAVATREYCFFLFFFAKTAPSSQYNLYSFGCILLLTFR